MLVHELSPLLGLKVLLSLEVKVFRDLLIVLIEDCLHLKLPLNASILLEPRVCFAILIAKVGCSLAQVLRKEEQCSRQEARLTELSLLAQSHHQLICGTALLIVLNVMVVALLLDLKRLPFLLGVA